MLPLGIYFRAPQTDGQRGQQPTAESAGRGYVAALAAGLNGYEPLAATLTYGGFYVGSTALRSLERYMLLTYLDVLTKILGALRPLLSHTTSGGSIPDGSQFLNNLIRQQCAKVPTNF